MEESKKGVEEVEELASMVVARGARGWLTRKRTVAFTNTWKGAVYVNDTEGVSEFGVRIRR